MLSKMLRIIVFSSLVFLQSTNSQTAESGPNEHLVGKVNLAELQQQPHKQWFDKHYDAHTVDLDILKEIKPLLAEVSITVFMGTWCHDSQREVPALLKILDALSFDETKLDIIALSFNKGTPKKIEQYFDIERTPTIVFSRHQKEIGRFVEYPQKTLDEDILAILKDGNYQHSYADQ